MQKDKFDHDDFEEEHKELTEEELENHDIVHYYEHNVNRAILQQDSDSQIYKNLNIHSDIIKQMQQDNIDQASESSSNRSSNDEVNQNHHKLSHFNKEIDQKNSGLEDQNQQPSEAQDPVSNQNLEGDPHRVCLIPNSGKNYVNNMYFNMPTHFYCMTMASLFPYT